MTSTKYQLSNEYFIISYAQFEKTIILNSTTLEYYILEDLCADLIYLISNNLDVKDILVKLVEMYNTTLDTIENEVLNILKILQNQKIIKKD